jgi:hypothetical protein
VGILLSRVVDGSFCIDVGCFGLFEKAVVANLRMSMGRVWVG